MATRPTLRLLWQRPLARFALLALLLAGTAAWYVTVRGGWINALHLPPVLDASTPRSQNGFTLVDIKPAHGEIAAYLFVRPPAFPKTSNHYRGSDGDYIYGSNFESSGPLVQVAAQTSNGDVTPLNWTIIGTQDEPQFYCIEIPGGYSDDCRDMNITLVPVSGPFARWHITRLPKMRRVIPDPPKITDSLTTSGVTTTAQAWRSRHWITVQVRPTLPPHSHQWELATNERWSQWETFDQPHGRGPAIRMPIQGRGGMFTREDVAYRGALTTDLYAPYRSASQYMQVDCELRQFETYDESVTFHNIAIKCNEEEYQLSHDRSGYLALRHPLTATTPSGIAVTLPTQGQGQHQPMFGSLNFLLSTKPRVGRNEVVLTLPQSPLARAFGKPVKTRLAFSPSDVVQSESLATGTEAVQYSVYLPRNPAWHPTPKGVSPIPFYEDLPTTLKDFTVIIRQRVDLRTIPMAFTVPVSDTPPPDVH